MNLNEIEKLEDAPKSQKMRDGMERRERGIYSNYPWNKVERFLTSRLGQSQDKVASEFLKLNWLPKQHRTIKQFNYHVETHTFLNDDKKICYFDSSPSSCEGYHIVEQMSYSGIFYIHPVTKLLCFQKQKKINWAYIYKEREAKTMRILGDFHQLLKLDGIWYEVKGEKVDNYIIRQAIKGKYATIIGPTDRLIKENEGWRSYYSTAKVTLKKNLIPKN